jgi:hypothetical protein
VVRLIFARFRELGSAHQAFISMRAQQIHFLRPSAGKRLVAFEWTPICYRNVISVLKNPFYAGAYAYGKGEERTEIVDGRARKSYGHRKPLEELEVLLKDHHDGYIDWAEFERNQQQLAFNAYGKAGGVKSGRGGRALLAGLLSCGRCGRHLMVSYSGRRRDSPPIGVSVETRCWGCLGASCSAATRIDAAVARELLRAVQPMAIEAAVEAERRYMEPKVKNSALWSSRYSGSL